MLDAIASTEVATLTGREYEKTLAERNQVTSGTESAQLDLWFDRAVTASTAAEVFRD